MLQNDDDDDDDDDDEDLTVCGLLMTYVDDLLITAPEPLMMAMQKKIQDTWSTSTPQRVGQVTVFGNGNHQGHQFKDSKKGLDAHSAELHSGLGSERIDQAQEDAPLKRSVADGAEGGDSLV